MSTEPHALTEAEWNEIGAIEDIREAWGIEDDESSGLRG